MGKVLLAAISLLSFGAAWAQHGSSASNMALLGHEELQGRSAYQPLVRENHGRWIAYVGLLIILYVALDMVYRGAMEVWPHVNSAVS